MLYKERADAYSANASDTNRYLPNKIRVMNLAALSSGGRIRGSHTAPVEALHTLIFAWT
jgi:hypothetical protein